MLYNLKWLESGNAFPPTCEAERILRYRQNAQLFDGDHFALDSFRIHDTRVEQAVDVYQKCAARIARIVGNFDEVISFPVLLNYQRLMTLKMADLVCGEYPTISGASKEDNAALTSIRDTVEFDSKLYTTVIDISRYGDAIWRLYKDESGQFTFTCWDPTQWYPIVSDDGTNTIKEHCLCWIVNTSDSEDEPIWNLHVQIHSTSILGLYEHRIYSMNKTGTHVLDLISSETVKTGLDRCAVVHLKAYTTTTSIYGYDDYMPLDSILAEIMVRIGQISGILDEHAQPSLTGPASMLKQNKKTGEFYLETGKFYAVSPGEEQPKYLTWDGQLSSAFKQLEFLINQLYILSEMGSAILGGQDGSAQAVSGTAMRFKMVNPLAKARRIANSLTLPVRRLFASLIHGDHTVDFNDIAVFWSDGLPDDPRENIEMAKLATGETKMMPLVRAIMEYFGRSNEEALEWVEQLRQETAEKQEMFTDPNKPGPQDGTGVNPTKKGSETGLNNFHSQTNGEV